MNPKADLPTSRRDFLKTSGAAALGGALVSELAFPTVTLGATNSNKLKIGLIGCGGRGNGAASNALSADSNSVLHAMGDVYQKAIDTGVQSLSKSHEGRVDVPAGRQFVGLDAYEKVLDSGVDVVILTTPPGFRPQHFAAAVAAGKNCFLEKPVATDAVGVRSVRATAEEARKKGLAVQSGFCWRANYSRREFFKRIHEGAIGDIRASYHTYMVGSVKPMRAPDQRPAGVSDVEWQIMNWYNFTWLSGDGLVEQAIHSIDKMAWTMRDVPPLKCTAVGGRQTPNYEGIIYDHIEVNYEWANGVRAFLAQRQIPGCSSEVKDTLIGTKGIARLGDPRGAQIEGETKWAYPGGRETESELFGKMYEVEHVELFNSIREGKPVNDGEHMCNSTLLGIMGRTAAYTGQEITWEQMLGSKEKLVPEKLDWKGSLPIPPMAVPGKTRFI